MRKIPFLVTKSDQILNLVSGKVPRPQICGGFHLSESSSDGRNIPLEGGGKNGLFCPPQLDSCQFEGLCLRMFSSCIETLENEIFAPNDVNW